MIWLILVLIYLVSFAIHILLVYFEHKRYIYRIGDIIDEIEIFMFIKLGSDNHHIASSDQLLYVWGSP